MIHDHQRRDMALACKKIWLALAAFPLVAGLSAGCEDECREERDGMGPSASSSDQNCGKRSESWKLPKEKAWDNVAGHKEKPQDILGCPAVMSYFDLDISLTELERNSGNDCICHYLWEDECVVGRPLTGGAHHVVACVEPGLGWGGGDLDHDAHLKTEILKLKESDRDWIGEEWLRDAQFEHASVGSFARAGLELMRHGAPAYLLQATMQAGLDEVKHARLCFALASAYKMKPLKAGPIQDIPAVRAQSLAALAVDVFLEGAIEESTAVLVAVQALSQCEVSAAKAALTQIADDEATHAALAWATVAWALAEGGADVRQALIAAAQDVEARMRDASQASSPDDVGHEARRHGRFRVSDARVSAWHEVIKPTLKRILNGAPTVSADLST